MPILKIKDSNNNWVGVPVAKGDTGENAYIWIKYSATQPTADSDMTDTPSPWIGLYSGTSDSAPSHYTDYTWYKFKGEQGEQGEPGETGATPDFSIGTVTTGEAGSSASASITGTAEHPVLNLTIPRGNAGEVTEAQLLALLPTDSVSGAVASFPDGSDDVPIESLSVALEPIRDLHGYSAPWVGGSGKNKFNKDDNNSIVAGYIASSAFSTSNTKGRTVYVPISPSTTYTVSKMAGARFQVATSPNAPANGVAFTAKQSDPTGTSITITSGASDAYLWAWVYLEDTDTGTLEDMLATVQIEIGSTATTYAPYSNICPISGWDAVNVTRAGKNLLKLDGTEMVASGWNRFFPISLNAGTYIISCQNAFGYPSALGCRCSLVNENYDTVKYLVASYNFGGSQLVGSAVTITESEAQQIKYIEFEFRGADVTFEQITVGNIQLELGSTATAYEAYDGDTYTIDLDGTRYGGSLDVTTGVLTVTHMMFEKNSSAMDNSDNYPGWKNAGVKALGFSTENYNNVVGNIGNNCSINTNGTNDIVYLSMSKYGLAQPEWIAMAVDVQFVLPLPTPQTVQLTAEQVNTLVGQNVIWADSGDVAVTYKANIQKYIDKKIAEL